MVAHFSFSKELLAWYRKNARDLPWRRTKDPYKIWISEIMLQQTTVTAVIPYYLKWIKTFPTVSDVARAPLQKILRLWQGLGYYQRAKNIHKSAKVMCTAYQGKIPSHPEELRKLPGFGPYTVGAVSSIAFSRKYPIVDANVRRVMMRQLALNGYADSAQDKEILQHLNKILPERNISSFNQALMELGALVCRKNEPLCVLCPVRRECHAYKRGTQEIIPRVRKKVLKEIKVAIGVLKKDGKYFIQKRPPKGLFADLWEFPGGKVERGETDQMALRREMREELGVEVVNIKHLFVTEHFYTLFRAKLHVWECDARSYPQADKGHRWVSRKSIQNFPMPSGSAKIVDFLLKES